LKTETPVPVIARGCVAVVVPLRLPRTTVVLTRLPPLRQVVNKGTELVKATVNVFKEHGYGVDCKTEVDSQLPDRILSGKASPAKVDLTECDGSNALGARLVLSEEMEYTPGCPEPIMLLLASEEKLVLSEVETNLKVENTAVATGLLHEEKEHRFLEAAPTVGLVTAIWKRSLSITLLVVPAEIFASENCNTPDLCHWAGTDTPTRRPAKAPPLIKVTADDELSAVDVPLSPDIVIVGVQALSSGTVLCKPIVMVLAAHGKGELWTIIVYKRIGIT